MEKILCRRVVDLDSYKNENRSFGIRDRKGRTFGAVVTRFDVEFIDAEKAERGGYYTTVPGKRLGLDVHATRSGVRYGASNGYRYFETEAERDAAVAAYFRDAEKRALNNKARA